MLSGNAFYRHLKTNAGNGNVNDNYLTDEYEGDPIDCTLPPPDRAALTYCSPGQDANSSLLQTTRGFGIQLSDSSDLFGWRTRASSAPSIPIRPTRSDSSTATAASRRTARSSYLPSPFNDQKVISVGGSNKIAGLYLTDTLSPSSLVHVTLSLRYNRNTETLDGYSIDSDVADDDFDQPTDLAGRHTFTRLNPAIGAHADAEQGPHVLRELQRGEPRADGHRARVRGSRSTLRPAERFRERSAAEAGRRAHGRNRCARRRWRRPGGSSGAPTRSGP